MFFKRLRSYFKEPIPTGMTQYDKFLNDIVQLTGPIAEESSIHYVVSSLMLNIPSGMDRIRKHDFVKGVRTAAAKQLAGHVFQMINEAKKAEVSKESAPGPTNG